MENKFLPGDHPALPFSGAIKLNLLSFDGRNGAGACTLTGAEVGDVVCGVANAAGSGVQAAGFEAVITVADQIQQTNATDLSTNNFVVLLIQKA